MTTESNSEFRCPFQIKGEKEGTIIEIWLDDNHSTRMRLIHAAFSTFHTSPEAISIRFHLPGSLKQACKSNEELQLAILPYQSEILAGEIDYRLFPLIPYQIKTVKKEESEEAYRNFPYKFATAHYLSLIMESQNYSLATVSDLALWVHNAMAVCLATGKKSPTLGVQDANGNIFLTISSGSIILHPEDHEEIMGIGNDKRNCFGIVMSPYYPKPFARYSDDITIVMSRMKEFLNVPKEQRRKIRYKANLIYREHGVKIDNLEEDKQPAGVWLPEYIENM